MTLLGVGPKIALISLGYFIVSSLLSYLYPEFFVIRNVPYPIFVVIGVILLLLGLPMLIISGRAVTTGFRKGELMTTGIYALVRNPVYAAWILFIAPGILVFFKSWLMLLTPIVAYISFKAFIREEYQYLRKHFGQIYLEYEASVNELLPIPKFRRNK
jgi:protein-S-isoprenylcysteine O-methyltransferase Ste14